jgi:hypothetical protein
LEGKIFLEKFKTYITGYKIPPLLLVWRGVTLGPHRERGYRINLEDNLLYQDPYLLYLVGMTYQTFDLTYFFL